MARSKLYGQRWKVVDPKILGQGGQGRVFKVIDTTGQHQGEWALKVVFNRRRHERFRNEVEAVKALSHQNIIRLIDHSAFAEDGSSTADGYLVMPIARGGSLSNKDRLSLYKGSIDSTIQVAKQLVSALSAAHAAMIVHRDVKPQNILFSGAGHDLWLSDFGICLIRESDRATDTGEVVGPRAFMAPELESGGKLDVTPAADVYSLGKLIYYLISGGTIIPRERIGEDRYQSIFNEGQRFQLLKLLLDRMISPLSYRIQRMPDVAAELSKIQDWEKGATLLALNSNALAKIHHLQDRARSVLEIEARNEEAQDYERERVYSAAGLVLEWLSLEFGKIASHISAPEVSAEKGILSAEYGSSLDLRDIRHEGYYFYRSGVQIKVKRKDSPVEHRLNLFVFVEASPNRNLDRKLLGAQKFVAAQDLRVAIIPCYAFSEVGHYSKHLFRHYLVKREMIRSTQKEEWYQGLPTTKTRALSDTTTDFNAKWNQFLTFRTSAWPAATEAIASLISEAVETFVENVAA